MAVYKLDLKQIPNQEFTTNIENTDMTIRLRCAGVMLFSLLINSEYICSEIPSFANQIIMPYPYMESEAGGNFIFITEGDEYPTYENFNNSCNLYFYTLDELNEV